MCNAHRMDYALYPDLIEKLAKIEALGRSVLTPARENLAELKRQAAAAGNAVRVTRSATNWAVYF